MREALLHLGHQFSNPCGRLDSIGTGQLVDGDNDGGLAIQPADNAVVLCAQLDAGDVFHANNSAIWRLAHDHVFKLFRGRQATLRKHGICELLVCGSRFTAHLARRIDRVLRLHSIHDVRDRDAQFRKFVRLYPQPHRILPCAENLRLAHTVQPSDGIVEVDISVVAQEFCIISALRGKYSDQHERSGHGLSNGDPVGVNVRRKLTGSQLLARLCEDQIGVRVRFQVEVHDHSGLRVTGGV